MSHCCKRSRRKKRSAPEYEDSARCTGWKLSVQPCLLGEKGGIYAGTAVGCKKHIGMQKLYLQEIEAWSELDGRFSAKLIGAICKKGLSVGTCYLHSKLGVRHTLNQSVLHAVAAVVRRWGKQWVIGGDCNCTPEELKATGWLKLVGGVVVRPFGPTCNDQTIDFFVSPTRWHTRWWELGWWGTPVPNLTAQ